MTTAPTDLRRIYRARFEKNVQYRQQVWEVLCAFFARWIRPQDTVLDLGCGWCEFINAAKCGRKFGMDLNPDARSHANADVTIVEQDCSQPWNVPAGSLDAVFTSNFLEHLPDKEALERTLVSAREALKRDGLFMALGPNIRYLGGAYWDFFDHYVALTDLSLREVLVKNGFEVRESYARFLPYTMSHGRQYPLWMLRLYLSLRPAWRIFGKQFLVVAAKAGGA